jgi:hypothetical protein
VSDGGARRFEYTVLEGMEQLTQGPAEQVLNTLGGDGWELVAVDTGIAGHPRYVFKRPVFTVMFEPEPELDPEQELMLRNQSAAQALFVLPAEERDALLDAILTDEERQSPTPPRDFHERVMRYFAEKRQGA